MRDLFLVWKIKHCVAFHLLYKSIGLMHISVCLIYIHHGSGNVSLSLTFLPFRILDRVSVILFSTKQENPSSHISQFQIHPITKSTRFLVLHLRMNSPVLLSPEY
jgi:hypothetical protein